MPNTSCFVFTKEAVCKDPFNVTKERNVFGGTEQAPGIDDQGKCEELCRNLGPDPTGSVCFGFDFNLFTKRCYIFLEPIPPSKLSNVRASGIDHFDRIFACSGTTTGKFASPRPACCPCYVLIFVISE